MPSQWVDFNQLRERLQADDVLAYYQIKVTPKPNSDQSISQCPLPKHGDAKGKCFSVNMAKGRWQCFGCKQSGNLLDLACYMEGKDKAIGREVRQVAIKIHNHFFGKPAAPPPEKERVKKTQPPARSETPTGQTVINPPLDFSLKTLQPKHEFFERNKIAPETVERFGLGFCTRGALNSRIAVPLHDDAEQLIGYAGLALQPPKDGEPKYLFPPNREVEGKTHVFERGAFLYNGHRIEGSVMDLIVVQECEAVWALWQGGFANVIAVMGGECSETRRRRSASSRPRIAGCGSLHIGARPAKAARRASCRKLPPRACAGGSKYPRARTSPRIIRSWRSFRSGSSSEFEPRFLFNQVVHPTITGGGITFLPPSS